MKIIYIGTILYMAGCWAGVQRFLTIGQWAVWLLAFFVFCCLCFSRRSQIFPFCAGLFFLVLGFASGLSALDKPGELAPCLHRQMVCAGRLEPLSVWRSGQMSGGILQCQCLWLDGRQLAYSGRIYFSTVDPLPEQGNLQMSGVLEPLQAFRNPGMFDMELWQRVRGLAGRISKAKVVMGEDKRTWFWRLHDRLDLWNLRIREQLLSAMPGDEGRVLCGMLLGGSSGLREEVRENFGLTGLSHLLSVSGTHLLFLAGLLAAVLPGKTSVKLWILALLLFYAGLCGFKPPVLRAWCMLVPFFLGAEQVDRGRLLALVAILLLSFRPLWIADIGFQLSFAATAGLIWLMPKLRSRCAAFLPFWLAEIVAVTIAAQLATAPFVAAYFHQFSIVAVLANLLILPLLALSGLGGLLGLFIPGGWALLTGAGWLMGVSLRWADWLAALPGAVLVVPALPFWCGLFYCLALCFWFNLGPVRRLTFSCRIFGFAISLMLIGSVWLWRIMPPTSVTVSFLDVHQGDCAVIRTPSGQTLLVDTGGLSGYDIGSRVVVPFLRSHGITEIDCIFLSHLDMDHVGGLPGILRSLPVRKIVLPDTSFPDKSNFIINAAGRTEFVRAHPGQIYGFGEIIMRVLTSGAGGNKGDMAVIGMECQNYGVLFTGDMDARAEAELNLSGTYTVLKAPHHGSKYSNSYRLYQQAQPQITVISVGDGNSYGHPHSEALARMAAAGTQILRTDQLGMVEIEFTATGCKVRNGLGG